jgi:hypothetical protein
MRRLIVCVLLMAFPSMPCAAMVASNACTSMATLKDYATLLKSVPTPTKPTTRFLPDDSTAKLYFHHVAGTNVADGAVDSFSIFESPWLPPDWFNRNQSLPLLAVMPAPNGGDPGFLNTDSVQLQFKPESSANIPWHERTFIIVDC